MPQPATMNRGSRRPNGANCLLRRLSSSSKVVCGARRPRGSRRTTPRVVVPRHMGTSLDVRIRAEVSWNPKPLANGELCSQGVQRDLVVHERRSLRSSRSMPLSHKCPLADTDRPCRSAVTCIHKPQNKPLNTMKNHLHQDTSKVRRQGGDLYNRLLDADFVFLVRWPFT